jgi:dsDNA-specific endonuclease/ATPase MutS2
MFNKYKKGDKIRLVHGNTEGVVLADQKRGKVLVEVGGVQMEVHTSSIKKK